VVYHKLVRDKIPEIIRAIDQARTAKARERGGFEQKIYLEKVVTND
jgi:predicted house-cleaning noncanonical NTP pyrophosphatase (MazG superfamily)